MDHSQTNTSLLNGLLDPRNEKVWTQFCNRYLPILVAFAKKMGLREHDAEDAAQECLITFARMYREGKYQRDKGRLRSWLFTIARSRVLDIYRKQQRNLAQGQGHSNDTATIDRIPDDKNIEKLWEEQWRTAVLRYCLSEVKKEVAAKTMTAFEMFALQGTPAEDVAKQLNMSTNSVFLAKSRILSRMRTLQKSMDEQWEADAPAEPQRQAEPQRPAEPPHPKPTDPELTDPKTPT